jgi:hypothetical protein
VSRFVAAAMLTLVPAAARADGGPGLPGYRLVWKDIVLTVEQDYPDYEFYLLSEGNFPAERLPLSPSNPVRMSGPGENYRYKWARAYAVPKSLLAQFPDSLPPRDWLQKNVGKGPVKLELPEYWLDFREALLFTDTRDRVEVTYRVEVGPDGGRLVKVAENAGNPWVRWGWIATGVLVPVGVIGLGLWYVRRVRCRRNP